MARNRGNRTENSQDRSQHNRPSVSLYVAPHLRQKVPKSNSSLSGELSPGLNQSPGQNCLDPPHLPSKLRNQVKVDTTSPETIQPRAQSTEQQPIKMSDSDEVIHPGRHGNKTRHSIPPEKPAETFEDELERLKQDILRKAHMNRFKEHDVSPEFLAKCREGPGTDPNTEVYKNIMRCRLSPTETLGNSSNGPARDFSSNQKPERCTGTGEANVWDQMELQWTAYEKSPQAYPRITDGHLSLSLDPTPPQKKRKEQARQGPEILKDATRDEIPGETWTDAYTVDWEYSPRNCPNADAFRDWFRRWLGSTTVICSDVDIFHQAFFNGTAHPDGTISMLIPKLDDCPTKLDMNDNESRTHHYETCEGYCHNWTKYVREKQEKENHMRKMARNAYLEAMKEPIENPNSPKANIYLRPVEPNDVPGLLEIFNWYVGRSPLTLQFLSMTETDVSEYIETCQKQKLPFIVAVEMRNENSAEQIVGYAFAQDFFGAASTGRFTVELQLFVKHGHKRMGVGRCLMDKLLEVCDPTYVPKLGYVFKSTRDDRSGYEPGGRRRLARLIFTISYPSNDKITYKWLTEWLLVRYGFENQGTLKGGRVKFEHFLDVSFLVRTIGYSRDGRCDM